MGFPGEIGEYSSPLLVADFPQMNFTQMHERLRLELLRRIERGTVSVSLLARQTGLGQSHLSNFLHNRRQLSLEAMDRVLAAQHMAAGDLLPGALAAMLPLGDEDSTIIPVISHTTAIFEPTIRISAVQSTVQLPAAVFKSARARPSNARRNWQRFVAIRISMADAVAMEPLVLPEAILLLDRHYNSIQQYRPNRPTVYAVRNGQHLTVRYADFVSSCLVLRPLNLACPVELIDLAPGESPGDLLIGRVALILNEP